MGVKTTYDIDRDKAIEVILKKVVTMSNDDLSLVLEIVDDSDFRNYCVHTDLKEVNKDNIRESTHFNP